MFKFNFHLISFIDKIIVDGEEKEYKYESHGGRAFLIYMLISFILDYYSNIHYLIAENIIIGLFIAIVWDIITVIIHQYKILKLQKIINEKTIDNFLYKASKEVENMKQEAIEIYKELRFKNKKMKYMYILFSIFILFLLTSTIINSIRLKKYDAIINKITKTYKEETSDEHYIYCEDVEIIVPQINNKKIFKMTIKRKEKSELPNKKDIIKVQKHWFLGWVEKTTFSEYLDLILSCILFITMFFIGITVKVKEK